MSSLRVFGTAVVGALFAALLSPGVSPAAASSLETLTVPSSCVDPTSLIMADPPPGKPPRDPALRVNVILPDGYDGHTRFPVLYLLEGGGAYDYWTDFSFGELARTVKGLPAIVVMPEASVVATYANSWNGGTRTPCWEHYFLDELIPAIEDRYRIRPGRRWHAVAGFSSGGLGAAQYAAKKPGYFGQLISLSGVLDTQRPDVEIPGQFLITAIYDRNQLGKVGLNSWKKAFGDPKRQEFYWTGHNPTKLAPALTHTRIYVTHGAPTAPTCVDPILKEYHCALQETVGGTAEATVIKDYARPFLAAARAAGADVTYRQQTGGHWYGYASKMLADAIKNWGLFNPVPERPKSWTYKTVSTDGDMWGMRFTFSQPPEVVETFTRSGDRLRGDGQGTVHLETDSGCDFDVELPFDIDLRSADCAG
jgi:S-formylglutathione hydrolase FrmB